MKKRIQSILHTSLTCILERFERNGASYPFVDTKFDIVTGRDFGENDEPFRRKECIYSWIQGRGLESLAKHSEYALANGWDGLAARCRAMLAVVSASMERLRQANQGRLPFAMRIDGSSIFRQPPSEGNFSDLFYSKGLFAAGRVLQDQALMDAGRALFLQVLEAIRHRAFRTDQQSFDPKNQVAFIPGKYPQGPRMIALGGLADFLEAAPDDPVWTEYAEEFIRFILQHHTVHEETGQLQKYDFIESLDDDDRPWKDGDTIHCDPGHALEFTGLAGKCLLKLACRGRAGSHTTSLVEEVTRLLTRIFLHVFDYGFNPTGGGICKGYDLIARSSTNTDMPWWSLPETVRAGLELSTLAPECAQPLLLRAGMAFQAFTQGFLQPNGFGCQTRSAQGSIINVIPAVSDADPGYHTNLSLIDAEALLNG